MPKELRAAAGVVSGRTHLALDSVATTLSVVDLVGPTLRLMAFAAGALVSMASWAQPRTTHIIGIVASYTDTKWAPDAPKQLDGLLFTRPKSLRSFYAEGSGGRHAVTGTVHPEVLTIDQPRPPGRCSQPDHRLLGTAIRNAGIDLSKFTTLVLVVSSSAKGCPGGLAYSLGYLSADEKPGRIRVAQAYSLTDRYLLHEVGHTEGLGHAKTIRCGQTSLGLQCTHNEYGNVWDTQGNGAVQTHQAAFRTRLGWIEPIVHTSGRATYTIGPAYSPGRLPNAIEVRLPPPPSGSPIKIRTAISLWIEYRAPAGFDSRMSDNRYIGLRQGAFVNATGAWYGTVGSRTFQNDCAGGRACLLDMTPADRSFRNAALPVGETWSDQYTGTSITVDSRTETSMTVTVSVP